MVDTTALSHCTASYICPLLEMGDIWIYGLLRLKIEPNPNPIPIRIELDAVDVGIMHVHWNLPQHYSFHSAENSRFSLRARISWHKHIYTSVDMYPICNQILIPRAALFTRCTQYSSHISTENVFLSTECSKISTLLLLLLLLLKLQISEFNFKAYFKESGHSERSVDTFIPQLFATHF